MKLKYIFILWGITSWLSEGYCLITLSLLPSSETIAYDSSNINNLAFKTFWLLDKEYEEKNIVFSPSSLAMSLSMAYTGSEGTTREEFEKIFLIKEKITYMEFIKKLSEKWKDTTSVKDIISANSIWIADGYPVLPSFTKQLNEIFTTDKRTLKLENTEDIEQSAKNINSFIEEKTKGQIKNMVNSEMLDPMIKLMLINVILFNAEWLYAFNPDNTSNEPFYTDTLSENIVPFMNNTNVIPYYEDSLLQSISLPYKNSDLSMIIILPVRAGLMENLRNLLDQEYFSKILLQSKKTETEVSIPKFKIGSEYETKPLLKQLGLKEAFSDNANFSGISGKTDLYISSVLQKAVVEVNERETKAAASTIVVMQIKSARIENEKKIFNANRPFIFAIVDKGKHVIIFLGKVVKPETPN